MRRLAARDGTIDLIAMDVIWTAEFGEAGWVKPWPRAEAAEISQGVIPAVLQTGQYRGRMYGAPLDATSQLLWYRKDLVPNPPQTWAEMIRVAESLPANQGAIQVQAAKYEGFTVWFNSLLASAGGSIVDNRGKVALPSGPTEAALKVMKDVATAKGADPSISVNQEDQGRLAFQAGTSAFMVNYTFVYPAFQQEAPNIFRNLGVALWPRVDPDEPGARLAGRLQHRRRLPRAATSPWRSKPAAAWSRLIVNCSTRSRTAYHRSPRPSTRTRASARRTRTGTCSSNRSAPVPRGPSAPRTTTSPSPCRTRCTRRRAINVSSDLRQLRSTVSDALNSEGVL